MPWLCTSPPGSPLCPSTLDTPTCHWSSSPCWSCLSKSLSGWEETSLDRCHITLLGSSPPRGAISSGEEESCLGNCKATRVWLPWELRSCPGMFILCIQLILFYFCERICCVCVYISEAVRSVSSAHVTALAGVHLGERHWGGDSPLAAYIYSCPTLLPLNFIKRCLYPGRLVPPTLLLKLYPCHISVKMYSTGVLYRCILYNCAGMVSVLMR